MLTKQELMRYPLLSAEQERDLARRYHAGDDSAGEQFLLSNLRLIFMVLRRSCRQVPEDVLEDMFQDAYFGLKHALDKFDPERGLRFSTYAFRWILRYATRFTEMYCSSSQLSLNETISPDEESEETFIDILVEEQDAYKTILLTELVEHYLALLDDRHRLVIEMRYGLGERSGDTWTLATIAPLLHVGSNRVQQIEQEALQVMRAHIAEIGGRE